MKLARTFSMVKYKEDWPKPKITFQNQVIVKNIFGGICGSDLHQLAVEVSYITTIIASKENPFTIGHEAIGIVEEIGPEVKNLKIGDRVVFDPVATCEAYGFELCSSCQKGNYASCLCLTGMGDGSSLEEKYGGRNNFGGYSGGGFSEYLIGFEEQFFKVPDNLSNEVAILAEPFAVSIHAALRNQPKDTDKVIIIGAGIIGLLLIAALRTIGSKCKIITIARHQHQALKARALGSDEIIIERNSAILYQKIKDLTEGELFKPTLGKKVLYGNSGPDVIYDCVANERTMDDALHIVRSNGKVVILGLDFSITKKIDWALVTYKELAVIGSMIYGEEEFEGKKYNAFELALKFLAKKPELYDGLVTHKFRIDEYKKAYKTSMNKGKNQAIKVIFDYT